MTEPRTSFVLHLATLAGIKHMPDEATGKLFKAIIAARSGEDIGDLDWPIMLALDQILASMVASDEKYERTSSARKAAGAAGGKASGVTRAKQNEANGSKTKQTKRVGVGVGVGVDLKHLSSGDDEREPVLDPKAKKKADKESDFADWAASLIGFYNTETEGKGHKPVGSLTQELRKCLRKLYDHTETVGGKEYRFSDRTLASAFVWAVAENEWNAREGVGLLACVRGKLLGPNIERALELYLEQQGVEVAA
ncbi:DUF6291 domain-containing protein [Aeromonas encheleia]|uniref:DUF6291 domain-containing protein n=1 Tax=Aeromonas encheleia TaxID=73010 RepID=UPI001F590A28|nr:DUF6291 domain-containing protein [Aeromonas encheleia]UNP89647.1 DUF6291 domain-containing protein [Aeromonas encheleia]